jgi:hypothetical protein
MTAPVLALVEPEPQSAPVTLSSVRQGLAEAIEALKAAQGDFD